MHKRSLTITVLCIGLVLSQGGNFLVAALCPHLQSATASCETQPAERMMSHEDMGHVDHMEMEQPSTQPSPNAAALAQPLGSCSHCAVHSRTTPNTVTFRSAEAAKRSVDLNIPQHVSRVPTVTASPLTVLPSRAHGPPGEIIPRHILINIFRI